jgi:hypothetical protein
VLRLCYQMGQRSVDQLVEFSVTRPFFGGLRLWFACPACGRGARKLFLPPGGTEFGCRRCHGLTYMSSQESATRVNFYRRNLEALRAALQSRKPDLAAVRVALDLGRPRNWRYGKDRN